MKIHYFPSEKRAKCDAYIIPCAQNDDGGFSYLIPLPKELAQVASPLEKLKDFSGKKGELLTLYQKTVYSPRTILLGFGPTSKIDGETIREVYAHLMRSLGSKAYESIVVPIFELESRKSYVLLMETMEGLKYGTYQFTKYKEAENTFPDVFIAYDSVEEFTAALDHTEALMGSIDLTRDLINMNACDHTPQKFGEYVLSRLPKGLTGMLYDDKWLEKEKMGLLLAVGQGSSTPPRLLTLSWKPIKKSADHTVLIGKGITFDTGGINLKPTGSIETMKDDMSGAAAVVGVMFTLAHLGVQKNVTAVIPLAENSIDAKSMKPGDVFRARSGCTVEIVNTDAEGRLILADALDFACTTLKPSRIIDVATLTGACEVALGADIYGLFSNSDSLAFDIERSAQRAGEMAWRLPLYQPYHELLKSDIADTKNGSAYRIGGAINAAVFLQKFVDTIPWVHMDIAGTAFHKESSKYLTKGATGSSVRTLVEYLHPVY